MLDPGARSGCLDWEIARRFAAWIGSGCLPLLNSDRRQDAENFRTESLVRFGLHDVVQVFIVREVVAPDGVELFARDIDELHLWGSGGLRERIHFGEGLGVTDSILCAAVLDEAAPKEPVPIVRTRVAHVTDLLKPQRSRPERVHKISSYDVRSRIAGRPELFLPGVVPPPSNTELRALWP